MSTIKQPHVRNLVIAVTACVAGFVIHGIMRTTPADADSSEASQGLYIVPNQTESANPLTGDDSVNEEDQIVRETIEPDHVQKIPESNNVIVSNKYETKIVPAKKPVAVVAPEKKPYDVNALLLSQGGCPSGNSSTNITIAESLVDQDSLENYIPSDLVDVSDFVKAKYASAICLREEAAIALIDMLEHAQSDGVSIITTSSFRSHGIQSILFSAYKKRHNPLPRYPRIAIPGHSEHQLGLAVDFSSKEIGVDSAAAAFERTTQFSWLQAHAHEYGFILSYPNGKEAITGYAYEPWHWRYVGKDIAYAIVESELTLPEYQAREQNKQ